MASCCRRRRQKNEPLPESQEFKPLTPDLLDEIRQLVDERDKRDIENKKKKEAQRELRKKLENGEITEEEFDAAERHSLADSVDAEEAAKDEENAQKDKENKRLEKAGPNKRMEAGKGLSPKYAADFQKHLIGIPLIDIDPFYKEKEVFIVVGKDLNIYRFSASNGLFCLSPFNPIRRMALHTLVHPLFNMVVMLTILTNCVFMAKGENKENKWEETVEYVFTAIYTFEFLVKMLARGMIMKPFTYLRDPWNWLDFLVISLAYVMMLVEMLASPESGEALSNVAALRTFRVLRALKTVAVVPGLKTIVGALMEAVIKMRDVGILTVFMLSIFALIGLQLYMGTLNRKCVLSFPANLTDDQEQEWKDNSTNWLAKDNSDHQICALSGGGGTCPGGYECMEKAGPNPNFGYTSWDNFGSCMLNSFRIMTQDYWENIYFITIRANGQIHFFFFVLFILLGSFYLMNLILAIVAMAYNDQQERDRNESLAEANEKLESDAAEAEAHAQAAEEANEAGKEERDRHMRETISQARNERGYDHEMNSRAPSRMPSMETLLTPKPFVATERVSLKTDFEIDNLDPTLTINNPKSTLSLPGSPTQRRRHSVSDLLISIHTQALTGDMSGSITKIDKPMTKHKPRPSLGNIRGIDNPLPYADDSQAVTPSSVDAPLLFEDYNTLESNGAPKFNSALRASLKSRASRASVRSRGSYRQTNNHAPNRGFNNNLGPDEQNNIPSVYVSSSGLPRKGQLENEMLPDNDLPNQYTSLVSLDSNNVNMKGAGDLKEMMDIESHARTIEEQNVSTSELVKARLKQIFCSWMCCPCFLSVQKYLDLFISDAFMEVFIMLCILCNTAFMAIEHHGQSEKLTTMLTYGNYFFTTVFTLECCMKLIALGPSKFFREAWNSFDFVVVFCSLVELGQELNGGSGGGGLSVLRSLRLLRVLKLAKSWQTLNSLLQIVAKSLGALGNLTIILIIVIFIFAVMGTQLFAEKYIEEVATFSDEPIPEEWKTYNGTVGRIPRWNFKDFLHGFMIVFRVLCGEWIESMWNCMRTKQEYLCVPFFLLTMVIGSLVVLNLFLVLLLSSFSADALDNKDDDDEVDKITEAKGRIVRLVQYIKKGCVNKFCSWRNNRMGQKNNGLALSDSNMEELKDVTRALSDSHMSRNGTNGILSRPDEYKDSLLDESDGLSNSKTVTLIPLLTDYDDSMEKETSLEKLGRYSAASSCESLDDAEALVPKTEEGSECKSNPELTEVEVEYETLPSACCCPPFREKCAVPEDNPAYQKFWALRCFAYRLVEHQYFETFIIICILLSSMSLAIEDIYLEQKKTLQLILNYMDKIFSGIFICEMLLKWTAFGYHKYFTDAWCWLDFVIVGISITGLVMESMGLEGMSAFKAMRTLRALRPLRAVSRWEGMRVVVNALIQAVPSISNVMLVILIFWLIFAIMGVNFFKGKFYKCVDDEGNFLHVYYREHPIYNIADKNKSFDYVRDIMGIYDNKTCTDAGYHWLNSKINFDNVPAAYLSLFQVATYKGWIEIMADATDSTAVGENPIFEKSVGYYGYFVLFIVFGSFFTLNLFIGVIIENFNAQKKKAGGSLEMFMTDDQKKYYNAMKKLSASGPAKATPRPKWKPQAAVFDFTMNQKFDVAIMLFILLNMITMCAEYASQPDDYTEVLKYVNIVFIVVFTLEAVLKLIALRHYYFTFPWNVFDFVVVLFSILGLAFQDAIEQYLNLSPTVLRVVRVFRVGRVLRLVKSAKGIRTLLFSLLVSLPALFNIGLLLFLVMFIYATFGMAFFSKVKYLGGIDEVFNFSTFFRSLITLFQCTTSAGWSGVLTGITNTEDCVETECGNPSLGVAYMVSYLLFTFLVIINMYIAVILENFSQATEDVQQGITQDDIEMYYELWATYDPKATKYIPVDKLFDLVDELEDPLRVAKPNYFRLVMTDIPVCEGDKIHCSDILDMLTRLFLGQENDPAADENMPQADVKEKYGEDYKPIYGLLERQRHKWAARFIWRRYLAYKEAKNQKLNGGEIVQPAPSESGDNVVATVHVENEEKISDEPDSTQSKNGMKKSKSKKQLKDQS